MADAAPTAWFSGKMTGWDPGGDQSLEAELVNGKLNSSSFMGAEAEECCEDLTFVITGKVHEFQNRDEFIEYVEDHGGHVSGSVSKNTDYLVNNDIDSPSSKNKKAKELGIPIITEDEFLERFGQDF